MLQMPHNAGAALPRITTIVQTSVRNWLLRRAGGVDLSRIDSVPDRLAWPLVRDRFDPLPRLGALREEAPISKLTNFLGINVWLVTGEAEARQVLADQTS